MTAVFAMALGAILLLGAMPDPVSAQTNPQSLIGEWAGTWNNLGPDAATWNGQYFLTIKSIQGTQASVRLYFTTPRGNFEREFFGSVDGNRLRWGGPRPTEFTVEGNEMRGMGGGDAGPFEIRLKKKQ